MDYFRKLPGFIKTPHGREWSLFKKLPWIFLLGTLLPTSYALYAYYLGNEPEAERLKTVYLCIGLLATFWTFFTVVAIGCVVVMIMKGPAYVADAYELPKEDKHLEPNQLD